MPTPLTKSIVYRGGVVIFAIPADWVEEYEPEGGGTFYMDAPESGTLRLNVLGFRIGPHDSLSEQIALCMSRDGFAPFQSGLGLRRRELTAFEEGESLRFFRWEVLIPIEPDEFSIACFAHTVSESQVHTEETRRELEFIDASVRRARFNQSKDCYVGNHQHQPET